MNQYQQLTQDERYVIYELITAGFSEREIGRKVGRHHSTISREKKRNIGLRGYRPHQAHKFASERKCSSHVNIKITPEVLIKVDELIMQQFSPDQVSSELKKRGVAISTERIYQHVWSDKKAGGELHRNLRRKLRHRRKRRLKKDTRGIIRNRVSIDKRPAIVDRRTRIGDWEGDTIIGSGHSGVCVTLVERVSKLTLIKKLETKESDKVEEAIVELLRPLGTKVKTLTLDNGKEFANHESIANKIGVKIYFAHPYSSWERGLNENTNGLIRQYFGKKMDFRCIDDRDTEFVMNRLNNRPRKMLNYETPIKVFTSGKFSPPREEGKHYSNTDDYISTNRYHSVALAS